MYDTHHLYNTKSRYGLDRIENKYPSPNIDRVVFIMNDLHDSRSGSLLHK